GTARTFDDRDGVPFISYDYYLDPPRPIEEATADLNELITLNNKRHYFLLMHIREANTVGKVAKILDGLHETAEVVPLDVFLKQAASQPTYRIRYQQPDDPIDLNP